MASKRDLLNTMKLWSPSTATKLYRKFASENYFSNKFIFSSKTYANASKTNSTKYYSIFPEPNLNFGRSRFFTQFIRTQSGILLYSYDVYRHTVLGFGCGVNVKHVWIFLLQCKEPASITVNRIWKTFCNRNDKCFEQAKSEFYKSLKIRIYSLGRLWFGRLWCQWMVCDGIRACGSFLATPLL